MRHISKAKVCNKYAYCPNCKTPFIDDLPQGFTICCPLKLCAKHRWTVERGLTRKELDAKTTPTEAAHPYDNLLVNDRKE
jgi:hypothetical protein